MIRATWEQVRAFRAARHGLAARVPFGQWKRVVQGLCGLQAQVLSSTELALRARVDGVPRGFVADALWKKRTLVKTWAMRGTLHLFTPAELPLWQGALSSFDHYLRPRWLQHFGIPAEAIDGLTEAVGAALFGRELTRAELIAEVARITGDAQMAARLGQSWGSALKPAAYTGRLCFAPGEPPRVRFTSPKTWVSERAPLPAKRALPEALRRFLSVHGPATPQDFARWLGLRAAQAREVFATAAESLVTIDVEGTPLVLLAADSAAFRAQGPVRSVRLLPAFDQFVITCTGQIAHFVPRAALRTRIYRPQGWLTPVLVVDGRIEGVWRAERGAVTLEAFTKLPRSKRDEAAEEAVRLGATAVHWGPIQAPRGR